MRCHVVLLHIVAFLVLPNIAVAQPDGQHFDVEVEPIAYILGGAGGHVGYQRGSWNYTVEAFGLDLPEALHGNEGFNAELLGLEFHTERSLREGPGGFYVGPEVSVSHLAVTNAASGETERRVGYSIGVRGGYRWYTGLGNLYLSPVVGLSYSLNAEPIRIGDESFDTAAFGPWGTVGIGWSFSP